MPTAQGPPEDPRMPSPPPHACRLIAGRWRLWQRGGPRRHSPVDLALGPACMALSSWSMGWLDSEKIQISATLTAASLMLLQRLSTCPPSAGCCSTCRGAALETLLAHAGHARLRRALLSAATRGAAVSQASMGQGVHRAGGQEGTEPVAGPRGSYHIKGGSRC